MKAGHAITFDVGVTLIEPWLSVGHVYAEVAARFDVAGIARETLTQNFFTAWKSQAGFDYETKSGFATVRETFGKHAVQLPEEFRL